ncbi:hypothetical protein HS088_TW17G00305 [Tripterygium wilfordii]|uniref:Uncharacterized protein n=1 Tax=Tripterygium wilfordii TaxID=458696 RepID=A0A7J7CF17_TRIWF|nr:hypothetical protein HS088_TW17G00305 [Tripterygium wilfordii]
MKTCFTADMLPVHRRKRRRSVACSQCIIYHQETTFTRQIIDWGLIVNGAVTAYRAYASGNKDMAALVVYVYVLIFGLQPCITLFRRLSEKVLKLTIWVLFSAIMSVVAYYLTANSGPVAMLGICSISVASSGFFYLYFVHGCQEKIIFQSPSSDRVYGKGINNCTSENV